MPPAGGSRRTNLNWGPLLSSDLTLGEDRDIACRLLAATTQAGDREEIAETVRLLEKVPPRSHRQDGRLNAGTPPGRNNVLPRFYAHVLAQWAANRRRVLRLEFAADELPGNLEWHDRC